MMGESAARIIVNARSDYCEICGLIPGSGIHHRIKRSQGGKWDPANLLRLCGDGTRGCHGWVEANPTHAKALGLWLSPELDPAAAPAWIKPRQFPRDWWLLDSDGMLAMAEQEETPEILQAQAALIAARFRWPS